MKNNIPNIILGLCFAFLASCSNYETNKSGAFTNEKGTEVKIDSIKKPSTLVDGNLKPLASQLPIFVIEYYKREFDKELKKGDYYLFSSKKYIAFNVNKQQNFEATFGWFVFLIKGEVKLSDEDVAEYDFYGVYRGEKVYTHNFLAQPVELVTELDTYSANDSSIFIWGRQWDMSGNDDGIKSQQDKSILISYP